MARLDNTDGNPLQTDQAVRLNPAANTGGTLTLPAAAGKFHYITSITLRRASTAALAGTATLAVTTTNLPGSLGWIVGNAMIAGGTQADLVIVFDDFPLKSVTVNTATTIVLPAPGAAVLWDLSVTYYLAS